jgi:uncharacterized protein YjbJ (UPF0337 family)
MDDDRVQGAWKQLKGKVKEQWGQLTDDDLDVIAGKRDQLLGRIQQCHGVAKDEADRQVKEWERRNPDYKLENKPINLTRDGRL